MLIVHIAKVVFVVTILLFIMSQLLSYYRYPEVKWGIESSFAQKVLIIIMHFMGHLILFLEGGSKREDLVTYAIQVMFLLLTWFIIYIMLPNTHIGLWHLAQMLSVISVIMITRLNPDAGYKQSIIIAIGFVISFFIAIIVRYANFLHKLTYLYYALAVGVLLLANTALNGANNWFSIGGISFQPSEIAKLLFLMFIAAFFAKTINHTRLLISAGMTLVMLGILVYQKDLGGAFIFYVTYISLAYLASNKIKYFLAGLIGGAVGGFIGYQLFSHVQTRFLAWQDPFQYIDDKGFQVAQSMFAISAGGWFGTGLSEGMPYKIPVVVSDFIYAGITEEFGNLFALGLICLYLIMFMIIAKMAFPIEDLFDTILIFGIGILLAVQTFLIVGGVVKMIPSTGVTMPLVSYGGTSVMVTLAMIGVVQGIGLKHDIHELGGYDDQEDDL